MQTVLLLYGGASHEHEVSCISAYFLYHVLKSNYKVLPVYLDAQNQWHLQQSVPKDTSKQIIYPVSFVSIKPKILVDLKQNFFEYDFIFPIIHGTYGEDGMLQGFLDFLNVPYVGANRITSSLCMHKGMFKKFMNGSIIPQLPFVLIHDQEYKKEESNLLKKIYQNLSFPLFVKPCNMGSSIGISKVKNKKALKNAILHAFEFDTEIIIEQGIDADEYEIAIVGNYPSYKVSKIAKIEVKTDEFYSYRAKYLDKQGATCIIDPDIPTKIKSQISNLAIKAYALLNGNGFARVDFLVDKVEDKIYLNEINTLPGFTSISMFPKLWEHSGVSNKKLIQKIISLSQGKNNDE